MKSTRTSIEHFTLGAKALSDPNRLRAVMALRHGELCICQITELLQLAPSTISKHMSILKQAGLVESRKDSRWVYYRLPQDAESPNPSSLLSTVLQTLWDDSTVSRDTDRLKEITATDTESLCRRQRSLSVDHRKMEEQ
jgi:DNA-binding transcriptional ArsR family regulator